MVGGVPFVPLRVDVAVLAGWLVVCFAHLGALLPLAVARRSRRDEARDRARDAMTGRLYVGTSGFGYPAWVPRFYPPGHPRRGSAAGLCRATAGGRAQRHLLPAPTPATIAGWLAATPPEFRFVVKALRSGTLRAWATDPIGHLPWLLAASACLRRAAGRRALPRRRRAASFRRAPRSAARRLAPRGAAGARVPGSVVGGRRGPRSTADRRRRSSARPTCPRPASRPRCD